MEREFYAVKEFAGLLRVHVNTIRRAIKVGRIRALKSGSGKKAHYRIHKSEIERIAIFDMEEFIEKIIEKRQKEVQK